MSTLSTIVVLLILGLFSLSDSFLINSRSLNKSRPLTIKKWRTNLEVAKSREATDYLPKIDGDVLKRGLAGAMLVSSLVSNSRVVGAFDINYQSSNQIVSADSVR
jgi:hypothetical protein